MENRKKEEIDFHNKREIDRKNLSDDEYEKKYSNKRFYKIQRKSTKYFHYNLDEYCKDKKVLDYCCGLGETSLELAKRGAKVVGIDISDESIESTKKLLKQNKLDNNAEFFVMDAENLTFKDNTFDAIICAGVLHHLDVNKAFPEIARVLKPNGKVICVEALGYNPLIRLYRKLTPHLRTAWEVDHILTLDELNIAKKDFANVKIKYFHLMTIFAIPLLKTPFFKIFLKMFEWIDEIILRIPLIQLMSWQMIFTLSNPKTKN